MCGVAGWLGYRGSRDAVIDERSILVGATVVDGLLHAFEED